jgi:hypothetical protein
MLLVLKPDEGAVDDPAVTGLARELLEDPAGDTPVVRGGL